MTTGPAVLVPALFISKLSNGIYPPALHLLVLVHGGLIFFSLRLLRVKWVLDAFLIWLILIAVTPQVNITQFLGECPGAAWFVLGLAFLSSEDLNKFKLVGAGFAFGLSLLSKTIFIIPLTGLLLFFFFTRPQNRFSVAKLVIAVFFPFLLWWAYQWYHAGSWDIFWSAQRQYFDKIIAHDYGAGHGGKSIHLISADFMRLGLAGAAYLVSVVFLIVWVMVRKQKQIQHLSSWVDLFWVSALSGMGWWVVFSTYQGHSAVLRHAVGFVVIALTSASAILAQWFRHCAERAKASIWYTTFLIGMFLFAVVLNGAMIRRAFDYLIQKKGYGLYSSWSEQRELAGWIDAFGSAVRPLPIAACDKRFSDAEQISHVQQPQSVISSGLFQMISCQAETILRQAKEGSVVLLNGEGIVSSHALPLRLERGDAHSQGLWVYQTDNV